jgi:hypothetical protein
VLKTFRRNPFCPEEEGSSCIRNVGKTPSLKKQDQHHHLGNCQPDVRHSLCYRIYDKDCNVKNDKKNHGIKKGKNHGLYMGWPACGGRGRAGMRMEVNCTAQTRKGLNILPAISV